MSNRRASKHLISLSSLFLRNGRELQTLEHCKPFSTILSHSIASQGKDTHQPNLSICKDFLFTRRYITSHERNALPALKAYERGVSSSAMRNAKDLTDSAVPSPLTQVPNLLTEKTTDGSDAEAEADNEEKKPSNVIVQAVLKKIKQGLKEVNLVATLVRGMLIEDALLQMQVPVIKLSLRSVQNSSFPIVNALETYRLGAIYQNGTDPSDSKALAEIQQSLNFKYLSAGDPCLPFNFSWDWLSCSNNSVPRIISLQLSKHHKQIKSFGFVI